MVGSKIAYVGFLTSLSITYKCKPAAAKYMFLMNNPANGSEYDAAAKYVWLMDNSANGSVECQTPRRVL